MIIIMSRGPQPIYYIATEDSSPSFKPTSPLSLHVKM
jgi:hypothetical protein